MSQDSDQSPRRLKRQNTFDREDQDDLVRQNNRLRNKIKKLSSRLDDELDKVAKMKVKMSVNPVHLGSPKSQSLQLQNAYKIIERLQKNVKDYQSKQSYQISFQRITDLQSIIKKKDNQNQELKLQLKYAKKTIRDKEKHIKDLLNKQGVNTNLNQEKDQIRKLKEKIKGLVAEKQDLKKKQLQKHQKLCKAQRKVIQLEQEEQQPVGRAQQLLQNLKKYKKKHQEAMDRVDKQNIYISKLNSKLTQKEKIQRKSKKSPKNRNFSSNDAQKKNVSKSVDQLPDLNKSKLKSQFLQHIPSPHIPTRILKRY